MVVVLLFVYNMFHERRNLLQSLMVSSVRSYLHCGVWYVCLLMCGGECSKHHKLSIFFRQSWWSYATQRQDYLHCMHITCMWKLAVLGQKIKAAVLHRPCYGFFFFPTCLWALLYAFLPYHLCRVFFCHWNNLISLELPQTGIDVFSLLPVFLLFD